MATATVRNGIDVGALGQTAEAVGQDRNLGRFTFRGRTRWRDGTHATTEIGRFVHAGREDDSRPEPFRLEGDEPPVLLGANRAPNAVEMLLASLGSCYAVGLAANAAAQGIDIEEMEYELEGDIDVRDFLGLGDGPRPGFTEIRAHARVKAPGADEAALHDLCRHVQETSPVRDMLVNPVTVRTTIEQVA